MLSFEISKVSPAEAQHGFSRQPRNHPSRTAPQLQHTANQETANVLVHQHSRKLLIMGVLMHETC